MYAQGMKSAKKYEHVTDGRQKNDKIHQKSRPTGVIFC